MSKFTSIARNYIVPAGRKTDGGLRLAFDTESDGLLETATTVHCLVIADLDSDDVYEHGPDQIEAGLAHLRQASYLVGHNNINHDLPLLARLYDWAPEPDCIILDTLILGRLILPHLDKLDDEAAARGDPKLGKLRGRYGLEAWGVRLGIPKVGVDIEDWSQWSPEMQERCVGDAVLTRAVWRLLQPDGYGQDAIALEHRVAPICEQISTLGVPFDRAAAEQLHNHMYPPQNAVEGQ